MTEENLSQNARDAWAAMTMLTGHDPEVALDGDAWAVSIKAILRQDGKTDRTVGSSGANFEQAVVSTWNDLVGAPKDALIVCHNRSMRWGGPMVGFCPVRVARKKKEEKPKAKAKK